MGDRRFYACPLQWGGGIPDRPDLLFFSVMKSSNFLGGFVQYVSFHGILVANELICHITFEQMMPF